MLEDEPVQVKVEAVDQVACTRQHNFTSASVGCPSGRSQQTPKRTAFEVREVIKP